MPRNTLEAHSPPPKDLTSCLDRKADAQYCAGGAFGDVYRCWCRDGRSKEVAVKAFRFLVTINGGSNDRSTKILHRELGIWRRLEHKNVVPFLGITYGFGLPNSMSLVSLWMLNGSLSMFLNKHDDILEPRDRLQFLLDIANGLDYLHSNAIVHGDLNGNNVLIDKDYNARLADFGHASLAEEIPAGLTYLQTSTTRPGTLRWAAPEQVNPTGTLTTKSDIYSFGCLGLQVLSGKLPWSEVQRDPAIILCLGRGENPGRPASRTIEDPHWSFIQHCWSSINERPAAWETIDIIEQFLDHLPPRARSLHDLLPPQLGEANDPVVEPVLSSSQTTTNNPRIIGGFDTVGEDNRTTPVTRTANTKRVLTLSPQDAYAKNLQQPFGIPLRHPEPPSQLPSSYAESGLKIGDVGYITDNGMFEVLFNICSSLDHDLHRDFRQDLYGLVGLIVLDWHRVTQIPDAMPTGRVICDGIQTSPNYNTKHKQRFVSTSSSGSILILPQGAFYQSLKEAHIREFQTMAEKYGLQWCRISQRTSLCLITGFYKTSAWHLASFQDATPGQVLLECDDTGKYTWDSRCDYRCADRANHTVNQTVLISGFKIEKKKWEDGVYVEKLQLPSDPSYWNLLGSIGAAGAALFRTTVNAIVPPARDDTIHISHAPA